MSTALTLDIRPSFPDLLRGWRKIRKISQLNLSLEASISHRHLSFLESGKSLPSRNMVMLLSMTLDLPLREKNALLNAAGYANIYSENSMDQDEMKLKKDDIELQFFSMVSTFGTPLDVTPQEIRIETFFPADDKTESFVRALV